MLSVIELCCLLRCLRKSENNKAAKKGLDLVRNDVRS